MIFTGDLVTLLSTNPESVGSITFTLGTNVFTTSKASVPKGTNVHIREYGGMPPESTHNDTKFPAFLKPSAQITCKAEKSSDAFELADTVYQIFCRVNNQFIGTNWYRRIRMINSQPIDMGLNEHKEQQWQFNVMGDFSRRN